MSQASLAKLPNAFDIPAIIRHTAERWLADKIAPSLYEINNGQCEDFAQDIADQIGGESEDVEVTWADGFTNNGDQPLLARTFPASQPTHGLSWSDVANEIPSHCWLIVLTPQGWRHYDAECPEGVDNFFALPLLRRGMERLSAARNSSIESKSNS